MCVSVNKIFIFLIVSIDINYYTFVENVWYEMMTLTASENYYFNKDLSFVQGTCAEQYNTTQDMDIQYFNNIKSDRYQCIQWKRISSSSCKQYNSTLLSKSPNKAQAGAEQTPSMTYNIATADWEASSKTLLATARWFWPDLAPVWRHCADVSISDGVFKCLLKPLTSSKKPRGLHRNADA